MNPALRAARDHRRFLDPGVLARIDRLDLVARYVVEGYIAGLHRSPFHGFSAEFSEHRQYIPGDPLKHLDWKVLARTNRPYLKRFEDETNVQAYVLLDRSGTMGYGDGVTKWDYARMIGASLAHLLLRQRDAVGLALFDHEVRRWVPARSVSGHLDVLLREMDKYPAAETTDASEAFHSFAERIRRKGLILLITDFLLPPTEGDDDGAVADRWLDVLRHFRHAGHDVSVFHVVQRDELDFGYDGPVRFEGLEGEESLLVDTDAVGHLYRARMSAHLQALERGCRRHHVDYHRLSTDDSLDLALSACLDKRRRVR